MKTLVNQNGFVDALEYVGKNYFANPYSITPIVDRWFNQLAMIQLNNGKILHLNGALAMSHVDITIDDKIVPKEDIQLVIKFHSQNSEHEKDRIALVEKIEKLTFELPSVEISLETEKKAELKQQQEQLATFDENQLKAKKIYDAIVLKGKSSLNEASLEAEYKSPIKKIIHRPNHGLTHAIRAGYLVTTLNKYAKRSPTRKNNLNDEELEKLQIMMLFSVVGRKDETGFNDTGDNTTGRATYESFRTIAGKEFAKYAKEQGRQLYGDNLEALFRDAITVELMGYSNINDVINMRKIPELLIDYVIAKELSQNKTVLQREEALLFINQGKYSLVNLFPHNIYSTSSVRELANAKLGMMNEAHGLDLTRCYPLHPTKKGGPNSLRIFNFHLNEIDLYDFEETLDTKKLELFYKLIRCSFDTLKVTGQHSMFGLLSQEDFNLQKDEISKTIQAISDRFKNTEYSILLEEAKNATEGIENIYSYFSGNNTIVEKYRSYLMLQAIGNALTDPAKTKTLNPNENTFAFHHTIEGNVHNVDHRKNAESLTTALQAITTLTQPMISAVKHDRENNQACLFFDNSEEAEDFKSTYNSVFGTTPTIFISNSKQIFIEVDRKNYQQLLHNKLIEFKQVSVPKEVTREETLIEENGQVDVINLITQSKALGRLVSTTALGGENFPDYDYLFRSLEDPIHERYTPPLRAINNFPIDHGKYYDPRSGQCHIRTVVTTPLPELRFQEPITETVKFSDKLADGFTAGKPGNPVNTIFTKKLAHSLLPPHGKVTPFSGYLHKQSNYFPIGVISDIKEVDLRDERYVWSQNMVTASKFWIRDPSVFNKKTYTLLNATLDDDGKPKRHPTGAAILDISKIRTFTDTDTLVKYLEHKASGIVAKLDEKYYCPTPEAIHDFKMLLTQERQAYISQLSGNKPAQKQIKLIYKALEERLNNEANRKHPKYATTIRELIAQQKQTNSAENHNEILAGNTKGATRALYASTDALFDRLNLAFHAMKIKEKYHYDVPLVVMSNDKPPYHYTETKIKVDLQEAYKLLREGKFPYDKKLYPVYELDAEGTVVTEHGNPVIKKNERGHDIMEPKNVNYQKQLLVDLFKIGIPKLSHISQLSHGQVSKERLDGKSIEAAISLIVEDMDVLGGFNREQRLMLPKMLMEDRVSKENFFLRTTALGHQAIITALLSGDHFKITTNLLEKAIQIADQHSHKDLADILKKHHEMIVLQLNPSSRNKKNEENLSEFLKLLDAYPAYVEPYAKILKANQMVKLDQLIEAHKRHGDTAVAKAMSIIAVEGWDVANHYLLSAEIGVAHKAEEFNSNKGTRVGENILNTLKDDCLNLVQMIKDQSWKQHDSETQDYCKAMQEVIKNSTGNFEQLSFAFHQLKEIRDAVYSPEMIAIKTEVDRLQKNAHSFFGVGNQRKANKIIEAVSKVPLKDRATIFSNENNPLCNEVRKALASHRIGFSNPIKDDKVDVSQSASSFKSIHQKYK